jgi:hypothetical protein
MLGAPVEMSRAPVLYVLKRFPRLSETFVLRELLELEAQGERILIDALLPPEGGPAHAEVARLRAPVRYLPRRARLRQPPVAQAHLRVGLRSPLVWVRLAARARRHGIWRRFVQAGLTADRARREGARHLHAHLFAGEAQRPAARLPAVDCVGLTPGCTWAYARSAGSAERSAPAAGV